MMPPTGLDEGTLRALAANCGHAYLTGARATGRPWIEDEDPVMSDLGLPIPLSANNATLLRPPSGPNDGAGVASRTARFFTGPGGGYQVWSLWPVDLEPFGFFRSTSPCMVREPGGERRPPPPELDVMEVGDDAGMREVWAIVDEVFGRGRAPEPLWDARVQAAASPAAEVAGSRLQRESDLGPVLLRRCGHVARGWGLRERRG
ncbi:MAG TPA: hypothetical protein VFT80_07905 [Actinomycetota bacterium]|nr:hypothetical protein [Actinomycetota bacterium]